MKLFLCGDVMTGRGVDQILPHSNDPVLHERHVKDARRYVELAEAQSGQIPRGVDPAYPWGVALDELKTRQPDARLINLETSITDSDEFLDVKGIHYRMHPDNVKTLSSLGVDVCNLANNHVLDFGPDGLGETLVSLKNTGVATTGAGENLPEARKPAKRTMDENTRLWIFGACTNSSGVPDNWEAGTDQPGVHLLKDLAPITGDRLAHHIDQYREDGDVVVLSIHWGTNWGYKIPDRQQRFARQLVESGTVDLVHGHSAHHVKGLEVHNDRLILYGCGDFLTDYEGISGHEAFRGDLGLMYFPELDPDSGQLTELRMVPLQVKKFRLRHPEGTDTDWLFNRLQRESARLDTALHRTGANEFRVNNTLE